MKTTAMLARVRAYLAQRRALGFRLQSEGNLLLEFAHYADRNRHRGHLTKKLAITWASLPSQVDRLYWARRLEVVRTFAKHLLITESQTELPPRHVFGPAHRGPRPFIYSPGQITQILEAAGQLPGKLQPFSFQTLFGLLACTGLRISEALRLRVADVDFSQGMLVVRESKFGRTRWVPLHSTASNALQVYARKRQCLFPLTEHFFTSDRGRRLGYQAVRKVFAKLRKLLAIEGRQPRIHDFRHAFACRVLQRWQAQRKGAQSRVIILSRYLGHSRISDTYWYLQALPELMAEAGRRFELFPYENHRPE